MSDHDEKFSIIGSLIRFLYTNYIIEHNGEKPQDVPRYVNLITYALYPLMRRTVKDAKTAKTTERDTIKSRVLMVSTWTKSLAVQ